MPFLNQQERITIIEVAGVCALSALPFLMIHSALVPVAIVIAGSFIAVGGVIVDIELAECQEHNLPNSEEKLLDFHNKIKEVLDEKLQPSLEFFKIGKIIHESTESTESTKPFIKEESLLNYIKENFITEEEKVDSNKIQTFCAQHSLNENIIKYLAETYLQLVALNSKYQDHRQLFDEIFLKNKESPSALIQSTTHLRSFLEEEMAR